MKIWERSGLIARVFIVVLVIQSALLAWQNHKLKRMISSRSRAVGEHGCRFAVGDTLTGFSGELIDGTQLELTFPYESSVLLTFFSTECPACQLDADNWNWLNEVAQRNGFLFAAVCSADSLHRARIFSANRGFDFPVFYDPKSALKGYFGITSVPLKVFVSEDGRVEHISRGARTMDAYHRILLNLGWLFEP